MNYSLICYRPSPPTPLRTMQERFEIGMHIVIDAPSAKVFKALRDYAAMPRYNPDLRAVSES